GIALALLLDPRVTTGLIADGEHVHPSVCEQLLRVKGASRIALTTDQTSAAGAPAGSYSLSGRAVHSDGRVVRLEDGTLAGSAAAMPDLVRLMARLPGMTPARAVSLASTAPARVLGERLLGRIGEGACAGAAGAEVPGARSRLRDLLERRLPGCRLSVVHDARLVLAAAGLEEGIALIAGTGSVAYGRTAGGREAQRGGWGWMVGDDG